MKLKIRYENEYQTLELDQKSAEQLCITLTIEDADDLTAEEKEKAIQTAFDEQFNRPDYNNWHKHDRHWGYSKASSSEENDEEADGNPEPLIDEVTDDRIFRDDEINRNAAEDYEDWCGRIRRVMKPDYAEMIIAIHLDGMKPGEYAESIGEKPNTLNHRLQRAEKKFIEFFPKTSFSPLSRGYSTEGQPSKNN